MKRIILLGMFLFIFTSFMGLDAQWATTYGGTDWDFAFSIQQTNDGGYIVAGFTESFGTGSDFWILKLFPDGEIDWQRTYGESENDYAYSIQQTDEGGYIVAGRSSEGIRILKLSSDGEIDWQRTYGESENDYACSIQQTDEGGYIVAGCAYSLSDGDRDFWILKLSSDGEIDWQRTYGGDSSDEARSIQQTDEGGYIVAGFTESFGTGSDFWILKLSSDGEIDWQRRYGSDGFDFGPSIQQTDEGGYIVAGFTSSFGAGSLDSWILKLSSDGGIEWQNTYGGSDWDEAWSIQQTDEGGYIVAGSTYSFGNVDYVFWILKLFPDGEIEWQSTYGGDSSDEARSIQQTNDGGYIVAGCTRSFGAGAGDFWILKLSSNGDIDPSCGFIGSSNATIIETDISHQDTNIITQETSVEPQETDISPQITNATMNRICSVATPEEKVGALKDEVKDLVAKGMLNRGQGNALIVKLEAALKSLNRGNTKAACNQLQAFINQVNAFINSGRLTPEQGQPLIDVANAVISQLCG